MELLHLSGTLERNQFMSWVKEFKEFAMKGNVIDLAVGVVIGGAFGKIVSSFVEDIIMPLLGILTGSVSFSELATTVGNTVIPYGKFVQNVLDFFIIALAIFAVVKFINRFKRKEEVEESLVPSQEELLLTEIRDLLQEQNTAKK